MIEFKNFEEANYFIDSHIQTDECRCDECLKDEVMYEIRDNKMYQIQSIYEDDYDIGSYECQIGYILENNKKIKP
tara:strand:+ start:21 stop:245 length:225 start_codon:yes stop_codon:yes gene_type:complete